jgi:hypothetical protein
MAYAPTSSGQYEQKPFYDENQQKRFELTAKAHTSIESPWMIRSSYVSHLYLQIE